MRTNTIATSANAGLLTLLAFLLMPEWSRAVQGQDADTAVGQPVKRLVQEWADESRTIVKTRVETREADELDPQAVSSNYDNFTPPDLGGRTRTLRVLRTGSDEVGDDLQLVANTGGQLSGSGWSLCNLSQTQTLLQWTQTFRWYDRNGTLIASQSQIAFAPPGGVGPGVFALLQQLDGFWGGFNIVLPDQVFMSVQFTNTIGIDNADMGIWIAGPVSVGSSARTYRNFTSGAFVDPGADNENLAALIRAEIIPSPSSLLGVAAMLVLLRSPRSRVA
jgi:hypothetical protein